MDPRSADAGAFRRANLPQWSDRTTDALGARTQDESPSPLTARETEILRLIANGRGNAEIAATLFIGLGTVKGHVRDILEKLAAADRTQAAVLALRPGLI